MVTFPNAPSRAGSLPTGSAGPASSAPRLSSASGEPEDGFDLSGPRGALDITGQGRNTNIKGLRLSDCLAVKHHMSMRVLGNMPGNQPYPG